MRQSQSRMSGARRRYQEALKRSRRSTEMIHPSILDRIRRGVCAVGYLNAPLPEYTKDVNVAGSFTVVGTGFLVREEIVITNRHVVDDLEGARTTKGIAPDRMFLLFTVPFIQPQLTLLRRVVRQIRFVHPLHEPKLDIALIGFNIVEPIHFQGITPVEIDDPATVSVSEHIAAFGFPHGNTLLEKDGRVSRFGPVLQQGWISGIAP